MAILSSDIASKLLLDQGFDLVIPNTYTSIDDNVFRDEGITSVIIPDSVTRLESMRSIIIN